MCSDSQIFLKAALISKGFYNYAIIIFIFVVPHQLFTPNDSMRLMLIDDDEDDRLIFKEAIKEIDPSIICTTAEDGESGFETLTRLAPFPDYIFLDINMPKINGFECLKRIRENKRWSNIPVIIHSTSRSASDIRKAEEFGANYYLVKEGHYEGMCKMLRKILGMEGHCDHEIEAGLLYTFNAGGRA